MLREEGLRWPFAQSPPTHQSRGWPLVVREIHFAHFTLNNLFTHSRTISSPQAALTPAWLRTKARTNPKFLHELLPNTGDQSNAVRILACVRGVLATSNRKGGLLTQLHLLLSLATSRIGCPFTWLQDFRTSIDSSHRTVCTPNLGYATIKGAILQRDTRCSQLSARRKQKSWGMTIKAPWSSRSISRVNFDPL